MAKAEATAAVTAKNRAMERNRTMSVQITLAIRPSLAFPERWSVDYWQNNNVAAAYQAALLTFDFPEAAETAAANVQLTLQKQGAEITRVKHDSNASREIGQFPCKSEEEVTKHLEAYVKGSFSPLQKLSLAKLFDITNWSKGIKALVSNSPHFLSLLILATLLLRGPFDRLLRSVVPKELDLSSAEILASAPLLLLAATLHVYMKRVRLSTQLDRVRQWILQATISYGWDRKRFEALASKELAGLEFASVTNSFEATNRRDPSSLSNLTRALGKKVEKPTELVEAVLRDDFARKIQALSGMASEPDYQPKQMAIFPYHLLISLGSVRTTIIGLLEGGDISSAESSKLFHEGMTIIGMMLGLVLSMAVICPTLIWTTILSWHVSPLLFGFDVIASLATVWLLTSRGLAVALRRSFLPKGLNLQDCAGAFNVM